MTTVGYGDYSATTTLERVFVIFLMIFGVVAFTFISGALSSIITNFDQSSASLAEKLLFLNKLKVNHGISDKLYSECRQAINFDEKTTMLGLDAFIQSLPTSLSQAVTIAIH